jgi:hypothetical protein
MRKTIEKGRSNGSDGFPTKNDPTPTLRLKAVRPMSSDQQQRFELLFDALIRNWLVRNSRKEGENP